MRTLVVEISGRRPGNWKQRPTERQIFSRDHVIISNDLTGYVTEWPTILVPDDFRAEYEAKRRNTDTNAWLPGMNRSYAIKYARENGYDYCVQLDDNISIFNCSYKTQTEDGIEKTYRVNRSSTLADEQITFMEAVAQNTNAAMVGMSMNGTIPGQIFLSEAYCYSFFLLDLKKCPDYFQGDFEDDIDFRMKCVQMNAPTIMICPFRYGKNGQYSTKDTTGNREAYNKAGKQRGEHMRKLYGDTYTAGIDNKTPFVRGSKQPTFRHRLQVIKCGVVYKDYDELYRQMLGWLADHAQKVEDEIVIYENDKRWQDQK